MIHGAAEVWFEADPHQHHVDCAAGHPLQVGLELSSGG
jgi:hypothetical protein